MSASTIVLGLMLLDIVFCFQLNPLRHYYFNCHLPVLKARLPISSNFRIRQSLQVSMDTRSRQWDLFVHNFKGNWVGKTTWYDRDEVKNILDFDKASEIISSRYNIFFADSDSGTWEGSGLRYSNGTKVLPLSRATYNLQGTAWQFPGSGGLSSLTADHATNKSMHEVYFFERDFGSMMLVIYNKDLGGKGRLILKSVGTLPFFRGQDQIHEYQPTPKRSLKEVLSTVAGWQGSRMSLGPQAPLSEAAASCGTFDPGPYLSAPVTASFEAGLVLAVPEFIDASVGPFEMRFACLQTSSQLKQLVISFDAEGRLTRWTYDVYSAPADV